MIKDMKKIVYSLAALLTLAACQKEKELVIADHGPSQTITCDQNALMGSMVNFSVNLQDNIALSTLKVSLLFDETVVADTTIRTKTVGTYEGRLKVPFEKNIPDGEATLRFVSQNIQFGTTTEEKTVAVSRPDFEYLTLYATRLSQVRRRLAENGIDPGDYRRDPCTGQRMLRFSGPDNVRVEIMETD